MDAELLKGLYYEMLRIRRVEEAIADLYPQQEMRCPVHLCIGQEAVAAGVCARLEGGDYVLSNHRSHGHFLAKGGSVAAMMAELYGKAGGCCGGKGGSMHLVDLSVGFLGATPIVGATIGIGVGAALGSVMRGEERVTVVFFGDAAVEEGVFHESVNFAVLKNLPVLFVCENNLYSVYSPLSVRQPEEREMPRLVEGHGIESHKGDGNDVLAVHALAGRAVEKARAGRGPTFIELETYRWREHCGPRYDNDLGYRTEEEFLQWKERCPLGRLKNDLLEQGVLTMGEIEGMERDIAVEIEGAVVFAKESPEPEAGELFKHVFAP